MAGLAPYEFVVVEPKIFVVGCVPPKIELAAGAVDVAVPNGLVVVATGAPNMFVDGAVLVPNANGATDVADATRNG